MTTFISNASWGGISAGIRLLAGFMISLTAIRILGSEQYGHVALVVSIFALVVALCNGMFTYAVTRLVALRTDVPNGDSIDTIVSSIWFLALVYATFLWTCAQLADNFLVSHLVYWGINDEYRSELELLFRFYGGIAAGQVFVACNSALVEGAGYYALSAIGQLFGPIIITIVLIVSIITTIHIGIFEFACILATGMMTDFITTSYIRSRLNSHLRPRFTRKGLAEVPLMVRMGGVLQGAGLVDIFLDPLNKYLLNRYVGAALVSNYEIATKVAAGISAIFSGIFRTFLQISRRPKEELNSVQLKVIQMVWVPAILLHGLAAIALVLLATYWLSGELSSVAIFFACLLPARLAIIFATPLYVSLIGIGDVRFIFRIHLNLAVINTLASLATIPFLGIYGAALGLLIAAGYNATAELFRYHKLIGHIDRAQDQIRSILPRALPAIALTVLACIVGAILPASSLMVYIESAILAGILLQLRKEPLLGYVMARVRNVQ